MASRVFGVLFAAGGVFLAIHYASRGGEFTSFGTVQRQIAFLICFGPIALGAMLWALGSIELAVRERDRQP